MALDNKQCKTLLKSGKRKGESCNVRGKHLIAGQWYCGRHRLKRKCLVEWCDQPVPDQYLEACCQAYLLKE